MIFGDHLSSYYAFIALCVLTWWGYKRFIAYTDICAIYICYIFVLYITITSLSYLLTIWCIPVIFCNVLFISMRKYSVWCFFVQFCYTDVYYFSCLNLCIVKELFSFFLSNTWYTIYSPICITMLINLLNFLWNSEVKNICLIGATELYKTENHSETSLIIRTGILENFYGELRLR